MNEDAVTIEDDGVDADHVIRWSDPDASFTPAEIGIRLVMKVLGEAVPMEVVEDGIKLTPKDVIELEEDPARCTDTQMGWIAKIKDEVLRSKDFFERVAQPVQITIEVRPKDMGQTFSAISVTPTISITGSIAVEKPEPTIHWWDEANLLIDTDCEVEPDGDETRPLKLEVWMTRYQPHLGRVDKDTTVEFSTKTDAAFPPDVFGPDPSDTPSGSGRSNPRSHTRWVSKVALPSAEHTAITLPHPGNIHVKAWSAGSIVDRQMNRISLSDTAKLIAERDVRVVLTPPRLKASLLEPKEPIPANAELIDLVFMVRRVTDDTEVKQATITAELTTGGDWPVGGILETTEFHMVEADRGELTIPYEPPELWYRPGGRYEQEIVLYAGTGEKKVEIGRFLLPLNPGLDLTIEMEKKGLKAEPATVERIAGECPNEIVGWLEMEVDGEGAGITLTTTKIRVAHSEVKLTYKTNENPETIEVKLPGRTDAEGKFTFKLPGLDKQAVAMGDRALLELEADELPEIELASDAATAIELCEQRVRVDAPHEWYIAFNPELDRRLRSYRIPYCRHVCSRVEADLPKTITSAQTVRCAAIWGREYEDTYNRALKRMCQEVGNLATELVSMGITAFDLGEKLLKLIARGASSIAGSVSRGVTWVIREMGERVQGLLEALADAGRRLASSLGPATAEAIEQAGRGLDLAKAAIGDMLESIRADADELEHMVMPLVKALGSVLRDFGSLILGVVADKALSLIRAMAGGLDAFGSWLGQRMPRAAAEAMEAVVRSIASLGGMPPDQVRSADLGLAKLCDLALQYIVAFLAKKGGGSNTLQGIVQWISNPIRAVTPAAVNGVLTDAEAYHLPDDQAERLQALAVATMQNFQEVQAVELDAQAASSIADLVDAVVLLGEFIVFALGMFFSWGWVNPVTIGPLLKPFELAVGSLKVLFLRLPVLVRAFGQTMGLTTLSHASIRQLTLA